MTIKIFKTDVIIIVISNFIKISIKKQYPNENLKLETLELQKREMKLTQREHILNLEIMMLELNNKLKNFD